MTASMIEAIAVAQGQPLETMRHVDAHRGGRIALGVTKEFHDVAGDRARKLDERPVSANSVDEHRPDPAERLAQRCTRLLVVELAPQEGGEFLA